MKKTNKKPKTHTKNKMTRKIRNYIFKKKDICCEEEYDREQLIASIFSIYESHFQTDYLDMVDNDIVSFIGYRITLQKKKDKEGLQVWDLISNYTRELQKDKLKQQLKKLLMSVPLFYLLAFLGHAYTYNIPKI